MKPFLSVIVPTKDRAGTLASTLEALERQRDVGGGFEVVVADNGSGDDTPELIRRAAKAQKLALVAVEQPQGGPAAARNAAVEAARGEVLLLLGDDTAPAAENLLAAHAALHRLNSESTYACLGRIEWTPQAPVTDFMRWLDHGGPQFHYWEIGPGPVRIEDYFYSSHISLKRTAFEAAGGFETRFPYAAFEDTDLGGRLAQRGVRLEYRPELLVWHDHPTTLDQSLARTVRVGRCAALYNVIRAEHANPRVKRPARSVRLVSRAAAPALIGLARAWRPLALRERVWSLAHRFAYVTGYRLGPPDAR